MSRVHQGRGHRRRRGQATTTGQGEGRVDGDFRAAATKAVKARLRAAEAASEKSKLLREDNVRNAPSFNSHVTGYVHPGQVVIEFEWAGPWINISSKARAPLWICAYHVTTQRLLLDPGGCVAAGSGCVTCAWEYMEVRAFVDEFSELFRPRG